MSEAVLHEPTRERAAPDIGQQLYLSYGHHYPFIRDDCLSEAADRGSPQATSSDIGTAMPVSCHV